MVIYYNYTHMGETLNDWVKNKVGNLADKNPDTDNKWIITALESQNGIANAKDAFVVQSALAKLGFNPGKIDGIFRTNAQKAGNTISDTMKAVIEFQTAYNLKSKNGQI